MRLFSSDDLTGIMRQCAGFDHGQDLNGPVLDISYEEMGFDSLAILEIQAEIERQLGVRFGDNAMETSSTPAITISYVNDLLKTGA